MINPELRLLRRGCISEQVKKVREPKSKIKPPEIYKVKNIFTCYIMFATKLLSTFIIVSDFLNIIVGRQNLSVSSRQGIVLTMHFDNLSMYLLAITAI